MAGQARTEARGHLHCPCAIYNSTCAQSLDTKGRAETYPSVFVSFGGSADNMSASNSHVEVPHKPGVGFEGHNTPYALMRTLDACAWASPVTSNRCY